MQKLIIILIALFIGFNGNSQSSSSYQKKKFEKSSVTPCYSSRDPQVRADCFFDLGEQYFELGQYDLAIENYQKAQEYYRTTSPKQDALCNKAISQAYEKLGNKTQAKTYLQRYISYLEKENKTDELIKGKEHLAELNIQEENYSAAKQELQEVGELEELRSNKSGVVRSKAKLKSLQFQTEAAPSVAESDAEVPLTEEELAFDEENTEEEELFETYDALDDYYQSQGDVKKEIEIKERSISLAKKKGDVKIQAKKELELANTFRANANNQEALKSLKSTISLADSLKDWSTLTEALQNTVSIYKEEKQYEEALTYALQWQQASDSLHKEQQNKTALSTDFLNIQRQIELLEQQKAFNEDTINQQAKELQLQKWISISSCMGLVLALIGAYFMYKNAQARKRNNQLLALKSLRSQMNPHFIFNALNSVNSFIALNDERMANKFIAEFSKLMRLVMDYSEHDFIPLKQEIEMLSLYLRLEHFRFKDKFDYSFEVEETIDTDAFLIPPMLIQPYIENAVWHGLRYKENKGQLSVNITQNQDRSLLITITDDGIGRTQSQALKTKNQQKHNSRGMKNIEERLSIINQAHKTNVRIEIKDGEGGKGTLVNIHVPAQKTKAHA